MALPSVAAKIAKKAVKRGGSDIAKHQAKQQVEDTRVDMAMKTLETGESFGQGMRRMAAEDPTRREVIRFGGEQFAQRRAQRALRESAREGAKVGGFSQILSKESGATAVGTTEALNAVDDEKVSAPSDYLPRPLREPDGLLGRLREIAPEVEDRLP